MISLFLVITRGNYTEENNIELREKILLPNQLAVELKQHYPIEVSKGKFSYVQKQKVPIKILQNNKMIEIGEERIESGVLKIEGKKFKIIRSIKTTK